MAKISKRLLEDIKNKNNIDVPLESWEQERIFRWAEINEHIYPVLKYMYGSLNGVKLSIGAAMKAKAQGLKKGFPDIVLPIRNKDYTGLFIELKRLKKSYATPEQKEFLGVLNEQGFKAIVCKGHKAAIEEIENYLR